MPLPSPAALPAPCLRLACAPTRALVRARTLVFILAIVLTLKLALADTPALALASASASRAPAWYTWLTLACASSVASNPRAAPLTHTHFSTRRMVQQKMKELLEEFAPEVKAQGLLRTKVIVLEVVHDMVPNIGRSGPESGSGSVPGPGSD